MEEYGENERKDEKLLKKKRKPINVNIIQRATQSLCKIIIKRINGNIAYGTGFFMKISNSLKCLITNFHVISPDVINQNIIELEIWNHKKMKLDISNRYIENFPAPIDITIIQIKDIDSIYNKIEFLGYDSNYIYGYDKYKGSDIFMVQIPSGKDIAYGCGKIKDININKFEFDHNISTEPGSSGSPIILLNYNEHLIQVVGVHKEGDID